MVVFAETRLKDCLWVRYDSDAGRLSAPMLIGLLCFALGQKLCQGLESIPYKAVSGARYPAFTPKE
jgi:hypothetical protein